ncbi:MAG: dioxygenase family protein [Microthrixaceae bacterium]
MPEHQDDDDLHDRGLGFDLSRLVDAAPASAGLERRGALKLLAGAAGGLVLVACGGSSGPSGTTGASTTTTAAGVGSTGGAAIPSETAGPFPGDGSNGPNALSDSGVVRQDIRSSFGAYSGTADGLRLDVTLTLVAAASGDPIGGAAVYLWHCDPVGRYSMYSQGATDQNWLRGAQAADDAGVLQFTTVFPGAYSGRYPHMHFEIYPDLASASSTGSRLVTSQLALPKDACESVYATTGYEQSATNFPQTPIERDNIFNDGYSRQMATVTGDTTTMAASLTIAV